MFFHRYRFEHPKTERSVTIRGRSYLWAGLFGAGYVWWIGYGSIHHALAVNIAVGVGVVSVALASSVLPTSEQFMVLIVLGPTALYFQAVMMVSIIRTGFRRAGWMTRPA